MTNTELNFTEDAFDESQVGIPAPRPAVSYITSEAAEPEPVEPAAVAAPAQEDVTPSSSTSTDTQEEDTTPPWEESATSITEPAPEPVAATVVPSADILSDPEPAEVTGLQGVGISRGRQAARLDRLPVDANGVPVMISNRTNRALVRFLRSVSQNGTIPATINIAGSYGRRDRTVCLWQEGGAVELSDGTVEGHALTIASAHQGIRMVPRFVCNDNVVNGSHALLPVVVGDYVAMTHAVSDTDYECVVYRITNIEDTPNGNGTTYPAITATQDAVFTDDEIVPYSDGTINTETIFSPDHPFIKASVAAATKLYSRQPAYVMEYSESTYDYRDVSRMTSDPVLLGKRVVFDTLDEAYDSAESRLAALYEQSRGIDMRDTRILLTTLVAYREATDDIAVVLLGTRYDFRVKSSSPEYGRGIRDFCYTVTLKRGTPLRYIDSAVTVDFDRAVTFLKTMPDATLPITLARVVGEVVK